MCFSPTASFTVAATTAVIGLAALGHARRSCDLPLAAVPLLFSVQQTIEGVLWLRLLDTDGSTAAVAWPSVAFLVFAEVLWPVYAPLAVLAVEPDRSRRRLLWLIAAGGTVLAAYLLTGLIGEPPAFAVRGRSIGYASDVDALSWQQVPYLLSTCAPLLISSRPVIRAFGAVVLAGFLVSAWVYVETFISVWCFFAAAGSALLLFHFRHATVHARAGST